MCSRQRTPLFFLPLLFSFLLGSGCVTRTERIYPYQRIPEDESVWEEVQREFGWQKKEPSYKNTEHTEPFYKRAIHGVTTTMSGWFSEEKEHLTEEEIAANRQRFDRKRKESLQRLREQQELD